VLSVSLVELCNNRVSNHDLPDIHHGLICQIHTKPT
jgi:hypothetical protein